MTNVVQNVGYSAFGAGASKTITVSATSVGDSIFVLISTEGATTQYTAPGVTDNAAGGSNTYVVRKTGLGASSGYSLFIVDCLNAPKSCTQITITPTGGSGTLFGCGGVLEAAGGTYTADQSGLVNGTGVGPLVVTASSVDIGTTNLVCAVTGMGGAANPAGISDPPAGYTKVAANQNDSTDAGGECAYRINTSALTDSASWSSNVPNGIDIAIIQSYKITDVLMAQAIY